MPKSTSSSDRVLRSRSNSRESASEICTAKSIRRKRTEKVRLRGSKFPWKPKGASEIRRSPRIMEEIREALAETMNELRFPFIRSTPLETLTETRKEADAFSSLRWSTVSSPRYHLESWRISHPRKPYAPIHKYMKSSGPHWNEPPSDAPDRIVMDYIVKLRGKWLWDPKLFIPTSWMAFAGVDWEHERPLLLISRDSSDSSDQSKEIHQSSQDEVEKKQEPHTTRITCRPSLLKISRCRARLGAIHSLIPVNFILGHRMDVCVEQRRTRHKECLECKEDSINQDVRPPNAICYLTSPLRPRYDDSRILPSDLSEWHEAKDVGRLITNMVATDAFPCQWRATLNWPDILSLGSRAPLMDYICQATGASLGKSRIHPLLFAAVYYEEYHHEVACKRLALAFQPMMTLFILHYLDTRTHQDEPMPEWMVLFGVVYDEHGLDIRACYPSFWLLSPQPFHQLGDSGERQEGWGTTELGVCDEHFSFLEKPAWERGSLFAVLFRIQRHCQYVLERLQCWDGYDRACSLLQSC